MGDVWKIPGRPTSASMVTVAIFNTHGGRQDDHSTRLENNRWIAPKNSQINIIKEY